MGDHQSHGVVGSPHASRARPFAGDADLVRLDGFVRAVQAGPVASNSWHVGDLVRFLYLRTSFTPTRDLQLWLSVTDEIVAMAAFEAQGALAFQVHPDLRTHGPLADEILAWGEQQWRATVQEEKSSLSIWAPAGDAWRVDFLNRRGFVRGSVGVLWLRRDLGLPFPAAALPLGWTVRHVGSETEWAERADIHRVVWHPAREGLPFYRRLRQAPWYNPQLDLVAVGPASEIGSYCVCWHEPATGVGQIEPVGTHPAQRRKGLSRAVITDGLRRLRERGARLAVVHADADNEASRALYAALGFSVYNREDLYGKTLPPA